MNYPILDNLEYDGKKVKEYFAIVQNSREKNIYGVRPISELNTFISHEETRKVVKLILSDLCEKYDLNSISFLENEFEEYDSNGAYYQESYYLGCFNDIKYFKELGLEELDDYLIGVSMTNEYSSDGTYQIAIWVKHEKIESQTYIVLDKWSISSMNQPNYFGKLYPDPKEFRFNMRDEFYEKIRNIVSIRFFKNIQVLFNFIEAACKLEIYEEQLLPVFLNIRDKNRSITALENNSELRKKIEQEAHYFQDCIERLKDLKKTRYIMSYTYLDFLYLLADFKSLKDDHRSIFKDFKDFKSKLTSSSDFKSIYQTVVNFKNNTHRKASFEEDQMELYNRIKPLINHH